MKNYLKFIFAFALILILGLEVYLLSNETNKVDVKTFILKQGECQKARGYNDCLENRAKEITSKYVFKEILAAYQELGFEKGITYSCHDAMHHIAAIEYKERKDLSAIFRDCNSSCFNACYHGAVLGHFEEEGIKGLARRELSAKVSTICDSLGSEKEIYFDDCIHGVGHALMLVTNNALPESLSACDTTESPGICYGGAFMENFPMSSTSDHPSKYIKKDDPLYPCNTLDDKYKSACYTFLTSHLMTINKWSYQEAFKKCDELFPEEYINTCITSVGISVIGNSEKKFENYYEICKLAKEGEARKACVAGVVTSYYDRHKGVWDKYFGMFDFCAFIENEYKAACYKQIGVFTKKVFLKEGERKKVCHKVKDKGFYEACLGIS